MKQHPSANNHRSAVARHLHPHPVQQGMFTSLQAARYCDVNKTTLYRWEDKGWLIPDIRLGKNQSRYYSKATLDQYLKEREKYGPLIHAAAPITSK